jgi:hypothetical protein
MAGIVSGFIRGRQARQGELQRAEQMGWAREDRDWQQGERDYTRQRRPVLDAFNDDAAQTQQQMNKLRLSEAGRADERGQVQQEFVMDDAEVERSFRKAKKTYAPVARSAAMRAKQGDLRGALDLFESWYEDNVDDGNSTKFDIDEDGTIVVAARYGANGPVPIGSFDDLLALGERAMTPETYRQALQANRQAAAEAQAKERDARAQHPKRFSELIQGEDGAVRRYDHGTGQLAQVLEGGQPVRGAVGGRGGQREPAEIQTARQVAEWMPERPGESERERLFRAYEFTKYRNTERPEEARRKIALDVAREMTAFGGQLDQQELAQRVDQIMQVIYSDGEPRRGPQPQRGQPQSQPQGDFDPDAFLQQF